MVYVVNCNSVGINHCCLERLDEGQRAQECVVEGTTTIPEPTLKKFALLWCEKVFAEGLSGTLTEV